VIVVDTNVIAYLHLPGRRTAAARAALRRDPEWSAPLLWRSEFRNVLNSYIRREGLKVTDAVGLARLAESLLSGREHIVDSAAVLNLAASCDCSAYDCEFVALALTTGVRLVTTDAKILGAFPDRAVALEDFAANRDG
jgi:predicted nucleic acid-binding protein